MPIQNGIGTIFQNFLDKLTQPLINFGHFHENKPISRLSRQLLSPKIYCLDDTVLTVPCLYIYQLQPGSTKYTILDL